MKYLLKGILFILVIAFLRTPTVHAGDYVSDAIEALKTSNIYVAPGTPGTDYNTPNHLAVYLQPNDNIVLIMFPSEALTGTDMFSIAQKISTGLDDQKTVGLAVGNVVIGYSMVLPDGVAGDKMSRAESVSNDPVTTLAIFTQNIHSWQRYNPQPTRAPTPEPSPTPRPTPQPLKLPKIDISTTTGKVSAGFALLVLTFFLAIIIIKLVPWLKRFGKFQPAIQMLLTIEKLLPDIEHVRVRAELGKACKLAWGLIDIYKSSMTYTGIGEDLFPVLLGNIIKQVNALIAHEAYNKLIPEDDYNRMILTMLNYDDLFKTLQKNDPDAIELMAANIMSENAMISHMGHLPTQK